MSFLQAQFLENVSPLSLPSGLQQLHFNHILENVSLPSFSSGLQQLNFGQILENVSLPSLPSGLLHKATPGTEISEGGGLLR
jgi:hypothetical protein